MIDSIWLPASGWSSFVLFLSVIIPVILLCKPIRNLINEYRLYRRCQQYPYIFVYKENTSTKIYERRTGVGFVISVFIIIGRSFFKALSWFIGLVTDIIIATFTPTISEKKSTISRTPTAQPVNSKESTEEPAIRPRHIEKNSISETEPKTHAIDQNFWVQGQSDVIFESSSQNKEKADTPMQKKHYPTTFFQTRRDAKLAESNAIYSESSRRCLSSEMAATMSMRLLPKNAPAFDSCSLSEKMRKRRWKGKSMGSEEVDEVTSRKRRKIIAGRMPLQGCVAKRSTMGAWQTIKILDKREREEREERLLRGMSRKKAKKTIFEESKHLSSVPKSTTTAAPKTFTPTSYFGQTKSSLPNEKQESTKSFATQQPISQFGTDGITSSKPSKIEGASVIGGTNSQTAPKEPSAFSFGVTSTATMSGTQNKTQTGANASAVPAQQYQSQGSTSDTAKHQIPPKSGIASSTSTSAAAPSFETHQVAPNQASTAFATTDGTSAAKGATSTPIATTQDSKASGSVTQKPVTQAVPSIGVKVAAASIASTTTVTPTTAFGAPPSGGQAPATANSFGATSGNGQFNFGGPSGQSIYPPVSSGESFSQGSKHNSFGSQPGKSTNVQQFSFGNTKENTNPGSFNSKLQMPAPSNGFLKPQSINGNSAPPLGMNGGFSTGTSNNSAVPSFGAGNAGGVPVFNAGASRVGGTGASARRQARRSRGRNRR